MSLGRWLKRGAITIAVLVAIGAAGAAWHVHQKLPRRDGELQLSGLSAPVTVRYDEWGVPHIDARNEDDLYRAASSPAA